MANRGALTYRKGPTFLEITDRRTTRDQRQRYLLDALEACVYLGCDRGSRVAALAAEATALFGRQVTERAVQAILDEFTDAGLVYVEDGRYLGLAIPDD